MFTLKNHSPSSTNSFITNRAQWYLQKVGRMKFVPNEIMARGTAVEEGINYYYQNCHALDENFSSPITLEDLIKECVTAAQEKMSTEAIEGGFDPSLDIRDSINKIVPFAVNSFRNNWEGVPSQQEWIEWRHPALQKPYKGKKDYHFPGPFKQKGKVVDCKITGKTPSELEFAYKLQGAVYKAATGCDVAFHFIIPLKNEVKDKIIPLTDQDYKDGLAFAVGAARAIERLVDKMEFMDGETLEAMFFPNPKAFYNDKEMAQVLKEFGMHREQP